MNKHQKYLKEAIELAVEKMKAGFGGPFGCLIVKDDKVIGRGFNCVTSSNDPTAHAEVQAIRDACRNLNAFQLTDCDVYTSCEPCPMCLAALYWARPRKVYFAGTRADAAHAGFDDQFLYDEISKPLSARTLPIEHLMEKEGREAFVEWINKTDKIAY